MPGGVFLFIADWIGELPLIGLRYRDRMQAGLYEQVVSLVLERQLESLHSETVCLERLDQADSHDYLAQYVCRILAQGLAQVRSLPGLKSETVTVHNNWIAASLFQ